MQANQRVSARRRGLLATSSASRARYARFTVAKDAGRGDPGFKPSGIRGMSAKRIRWRFTRVGVGTDLPVCRLYPYGVHRYADPQKQPT
jgi:hypothetical protein